MGIRGLGRRPHPGQGQDNLRARNAAEFGDLQRHGPREHFYGASRIHRRRAFAGGIVVAIALAALVNPLVVSGTSGATLPRRLSSHSVATTTKSTIRRIRRQAPTTTTQAPTTTTQAPVAVGSLQPVGDDPGPWNLVFDSEFNGSSLDTSQWSTGWFGSGITGPIDAPYELNVYSPAQATVSGGALHLTAVAEQNTDSNGTFSYTSGVVTTMAPTYPWTVPALFSFTYGYMEARIWMPGTSGVADWPIFWAHGFSPDATDGEIDIAEGMGGYVGATFHNSAGAQGTTFSTESLAGGWHTFAADWEPGSITYYYDGVEIARYTSGITSSPMYLVLNLAISSMLSPPVVVPVTMLVDYVRVWQH